MKKALFIFLVFICFLFCSCENSDSKVFHWTDLIPGQHNYTSGPKPSELIGSRWECKEVDLYFEVTETDNVEEAEPVITGIYSSQTENIPISIRFNMGKQMFVYEMNENEFEQKMEGVCKFGETQMIVSVNTETDELLSGRFDTLTFCRVS